MFEVKDFTKNIIITSLLSKLVITGSIAAALVQVRIRTWIADSHWSAPPPPNPPNPKNKTPFVSKCVVILFK